MRSVAELLRDDAGRRLLADRGVLCDAEEFVRLLRAPADGALVRALALDRPHPVYVHQQTQVDYPGSVASKFRAAVALRNQRDVAPIALWIDTDRAKTASSTIVIRSGCDEFRRRLVPHRLRDVETRFITVDLDHVRAALTALGGWLDQRLPSSPARTQMRARLKQLDDSLEAAPATQTLAEVNLALSSVMLRERLGFAPASMLVSQVAVSGMLETALDGVLNEIVDIITVFNAQVAALICADIDPCVHALPDDYLPLHFSCPRDGLRRRLAHRREGADHLAVAACRCGTTYRFHLGAHRLSIAELAATGRWSVDVSLPLFIDGLVSGMIVGRSSASYGLVLNQVATTVLGISPVPMLVPADLPEAMPHPDHPDSVLFGFLTMP
jgi:hypothetical protein